MLCAALVVIDDRIDFTEEIGAVVVSDKGCEKD